MEKLLNKKNKTYNDYLELSSKFIEEETPFNGFKYIKEGFGKGNANISFTTFLIFLENMI